MKINFKSIKDKETIEYEADANLLNELNSDTFVKKFNKVEGEISFDNTGDVLVVTFDLSYSLEVLSTVSLKPFEYNSQLKDELYLTNNKEMENEEIIYLKDGFEIDELIYSLVITDLPITLKMDDETYPESEEFKVLSEDEYNSLKEEDSDSPFDSLKDINFDD